MAAPGRKRFGIELLRPEQTPDSEERFGGVIRAEGPGGDQTRRYVEVLETTAPFTADGLALVADAVTPAYDDFGPRCLRVR